jgi:hypothetical protein
MAEGAFDDIRKRPSRNDLARELGRSWAAWKDLTGALSGRFGPLTEDWRYAGDRWGWSLRLKRKDRTIVYLLPCRKFFRVTMVLGDKAVRKALASELPEEVVTAIKGAKKYPEGTALRFEVRFKKELPPVVRLVESKMST